MMEGNAMAVDPTPTEGEQRAIHTNEFTLYRNAEAAWGHPDVLSLPSGTPVFLDPSDADALQPLFEQLQVEELRALAALAPVSTEERERLAEAIERVESVLLGELIGWCEDGEDGAWPPTQPHAEHTFHGACAVCRCGDRPEAMSALIEAAARALLASPTAAPPEPEPEPDLCERRLMTLGTDGHHDCARPADHAVHADPSHRAHHDFYRYPPAPPAAAVVVPLLSNPHLPTPAAPLGEQEAAPETETERILRLLPDADASMGWRRCRGTEHAPGDAPHGWWDDHEPDATRWPCPGFVSLHDIGTEREDVYLDDLSARINAAAPPSPLPVAAETGDKVN